MTWIAAVASFFGAIVEGVKWLTGYEQRKAGATTASLERAEEEARRAKERGKTDASVRATPRDDLERELFNPDAGNR